MKNQKALINLILVVVVLGLGFLILKDSKILNSRSDDSPENQTQSQPAKTKEEEVLNFPPSDSSQEVKDKHFKLLLELAKDTNEITLKGCKPEPLVAQVKENSKLKFTNKDAKSHLILFNKDYQYNVKAGSSVEIKVDLDKGTGVYGYACDDGNVTAGILRVLP